MFRNVKCHTNLFTEIDDMKEWETGRRKGAEMMRSTEHSQSQTPLANWDTCPPGELQRLVKKLNVVEHCAKRKRFCFCWIAALLLVGGLIVGFLLKG